MLSRKRLLWLLRNWSATKLFTLCRCPKEFFFSYVLTERERLLLQEKFGYFPLDSALAWGANLHFMFKRFFSVRFASPESFAQQIRYLWSGVERREKNPGQFSVRTEKDARGLLRPLLFRSKEQKERYHALILPIAREFFWINAPFLDGTNPVPLLEYPIQIPLCISLIDAFGREEETRRGNAIRVVLAGHLDRVQPLAFGTFPAARLPYRIQDYKTGLVPGPEEASRAEQQLFYRVLTHLRFAYEADAFDYIKIPGHAMQTVEYAHDGDGLARGFSQVEWWVREAWAFVMSTLDPCAAILDHVRWRLLDPNAVMHGELRPQPGPYCETCAFRRLCKVGAPFSREAVAFAEGIEETLLAERRDDIQGTLFFNVSSMRREREKRRRRLVSQYKAHIRRMRKDVWSGGSGRSLLT